MKSSYKIRELDVQREKLSDDTEAADLFKDYFEIIIDKEGYRQVNECNANAWFVSIL